MQRRGFPGRGWPKLLELIPGGTDGTGPVLRAPSQLAEALVCCVYMCMLYVCVLYVYVCEWCVHVVCVFSVCICV